MITRIKTWLFITIFKLFTFRGCHRDLSPRPGSQQPVAVTHHLHHGHDIIPRYFSVSVFHNRLHDLYHVISSFYLIYILRCKNKNINCIILTFGHLKFQAGISKTGQGRKRKQNHSVLTTNRKRLSDLKSRSGKDTKGKPLSIRERSHYEMK